MLALFDGNVIHQMLPLQYILNIHSNVCSPMYSISSSLVAGPKNELKERESSTKSKLGKPDYFGKKMKFKLL